MAKLWAVAKREYLERVRSRWFVVATLLGPLLMALAILLPIYMRQRSLQTTRASNITILDATSSELGDAVARALGTGMQGDTSSARVVRVATADMARAESTAMRDVMAKRIEGYLVLDSATAIGESARYAGRNASTIPDMERIERRVEQAILANRLRSAGLDPDRVRELSRVNIQMTTERITDQGRGGSGAGSIAVAFIASFVLYMMIVLYGQTILRGVIDEKSNRVAEVVVASVRPESLLAGKVLGVGSVALTQLAVWVLSLALLIKFRGPVLSYMGMPNATIPLPQIGIFAIITLLLFFVLGFILYAALFAAIGAMVSNDQDAQQAATPVMIVIAMSAVFIQPVLLSPTATLSKAASWIPFSAPILMPVRSGIVAVPWWEVVLVMLGLVVACMVCVWFAARIYRVGILMYGKRPSLMELARWIRYTR
ncbi:MAG TPA: ABC transporter permease [Gemmatimonadaceae bacterium]|nr:ABC transporter permease [Gemmatimonadaceae bacterium]